MSDKVNFCIVIHDHQPTGNFDSVMAAAYDSAYLPFMEVLERFPAVRIGLHVSGCLLDWIEANRPKFIDRVAACVERGQVEILAGGYYEPIMTMLPERDRIGQITMMRDYIKRRFGTEARGLWLTERVWEQCLASSLAKAGIHYTLTDDTHFLHAGLRENELDGYYVTEDNGRTLKVAPISKKLRYLIPFRNPEETIEYLGSAADTAGTKLLVYGDDGEKFGVWPKTHAHVYGERWLERFFGALSDNASWINMALPGEAMDSLPSRGKIYLPDASYQEMTEWALPVQTRGLFEEARKIFDTRPEFADVQQFVKGGFWRNFKVRYDEANDMYARMMLVSDKVEALPHDSADYDRARKALYEGQCNCAFWHGVFGGLYLPHLRAAVYKKLIEAEALADAASGARDLPCVETCDFDFDGNDDVLVQTGALNYVVKPARGGAIFEIDVVDKGFNLLAGLNRRRETYHAKLGKKAGIDAVASIHDIIESKEEGLEKILFYDKYPRKSLVDHVLGDDADAGKFLRGELDEIIDFKNTPYSVDMPEHGETSIVLRATGRGHFGGEPCDLALEKRLTFPQPGNMLVGYKVTNHSNETIAFKLGIEFNMAMLAGRAHDRYYYTSETDNDGDLSGNKTYPALTGVGVSDEWSGIRAGLSTTQPVEVWTAPVETVSVSEEGFERLYQSSALMLLFKIELDPGCEWHGEVTHRVETK